MEVSLADAPWLAHIACGAIYLAMAVLVVSRRPRATLNRTCGFLILCFAFWCGCLAVSHHPLVSKETAALFYNVGALGWGGFASAAVLFMASFWRPTLLRSRAFVAALVLPPLVVIHAQWTGGLASDYPSLPWGHGFKWRDSAQATFFITYYTIYMVAGVGVLLWTAKRERAPVKRRQARIIAMSALLPLGLGSLTDVVLPRAGIFALPNMAPDFAIIWVLGLSYAIVRYRMLELRPAVAADRVVETMSDGLLMVDAERRITWANPAAVSLFGNTTEGLRRTTIDQLLRGAPVEAAPGDDGGDVPGRREVTVQRADGAEVEVDYSMSEVRGDLREVVGWVCVATDVSTRKRAEVALRQSRDALESRVAERTGELEEVNGRLRVEVSERKRSQEHYRLLIESMHEGLWVLDASDHTTLVNARLADILGRDSSDILGRPLLDFVDESSSAACAEALRQAHAGTPGQGDWHLRHPHGRPRNTIVQVSPLRGDGDGDAYRGCVLTVMDVTERESMQVQLARAQRLASLGLLAAGVGHEINNPLTFVTLNLEEINRLADPGGEIATLSKEALEGVRRVQDIVKDLRRFSRGEPRALTPVDVHEALDSAIKLGQNQFRFRARLVRQYGPAIPKVVADLGGLSQVFLNLIVNAAQAIPEGKVDDNEIRVKTSYSGGEVMVELADTGKGIPPEDMERIFDPFFSTKLSADGLGLGLAMCHETIASLGGRIFVGSEVGRGSRFLVSLPAVASAAGAGAQADGVVAAAASPSSTGEVAVPAPAAVRLLLVDDEDLIRRSLARVLGQHFQVVACRSGEEARRAIEADARFDLVLCDLMMPGMSGMALSEWVAANVPELSVRMVFMTGGAFSPESQRFLDSTPHPTLEKPFRPAEVVAVVHETLERIARAR